MGNVSFSTSEVLAVIGGAAGLVTAIWHAAMYVGKLTVKVDRHEDRLNDHEDRIERFTGSIR
jgi:NADP-dependent 3-hydroxy acid dehydrogenase YdfG